MCIALIYCDFYIMTLGKSNRTLMIFGCTNLIAQNHCFWISSLTCVKELLYCSSLTCLDLCWFDIFYYNRRQTLSRPVCWRRSLQLGWRWRWKIGSRKQDALWPPTGHWGSTWQRYIIHSLWWSPFCSYHCHRWDFQNYVIKINAQYFEFLELTSSFIWYFRRGSKNR